MKKLAVLGSILIAVATFAAQNASQKEKDKKQENECPLHEQHMKAKANATGHEHSFDEMNKRGEDERGMGFSQSETTHHFLLAKDGGAIQVEVNDPKDNATISTVRAHLQKIASSFSSGDFDIPNFVHGRNPDGVDSMKKAGGKIQYRYEELAAGGRVEISTKDKKGLSAVHDFLRFQIVEHRTGDSIATPQ